jgi:hypothetical protein
MGWVKRLIVLEPIALRQGEYVHCAAQQFCLIFAPELGAAPDLGKIHKLLFFKVKNAVPAARVNDAMRNRDAALC